MRVRVVLVESDGFRQRVAAILHEHRDRAGDLAGGAERAQMVARAGQRGPRAVAVVAGRPREAARPFVITLGGKMENMHGRCSEPNAARHHWRRENGPEYR